MASAPPINTAPIAAGMSVIAKSPPPGKSPK